MDISRYEKLYQQVENFVEEILFVDPFREQIVRFEPKIFFYGYAFLGGFSFDERIRKGVRKVYMIYHHVSAVVILAFCTFYLSDLIEKNFRAVVCGAIPIFAVLMRLSYFWTFHYYRKKFVILVDYFMDKFKPWNEPASNEENLVDRINVKNWAIAIISHFLISYFLLEGFLDMDTVIGGGGSYTERFFVSKHFPVWCPFENTPLVSHLLRVFQSVMYAPHLFGFMGGFTFMLMFIVEIYNEFIALRDKLRSISARVFERMERLENMEEEATKVSESFLRWTAKNAEKQRARILEVFQVEFVECIEQYQQLRRMAELAKTYLEVYNSVTCFFTLFELVFIGFLSTLVLDNAEGFEGTVVLAALGLSFSVLYASCILGEVFKGMNEVFVEEVYSTPWYYLQPKDRKVVLVFLGLARRSLGLRVLKIVTLARDILPKYLDMVKSYTQIMLLCYRRNAHHA